MNIRKWVLDSHRFAFTVICLLSAFTVPCSLQADIVTIDYSGIYTQETFSTTTGQYTPSGVTGTVAGSFTFDNAAGTVLQGTVTASSLPTNFDFTCMIPLGEFLQRCGTSALPGGGLELALNNQNFTLDLDFFISENSLVGKTDLTPVLTDLSGPLSGEGYGLFSYVDSVDCGDFPCYLSSLTFSPVPEPSTMVSLAVGLVFLSLRRLARR